MRGEQVQLSMEQLLPERGNGFTVSTGHHTVDRHRMEYDMGSQVIGEGGRHQHGDRKLARVFGKLVQPGSFLWIGGGAAYLIVGQV